MQNYSSPSSRDKSLAAKSSGKMPNSEIPAKIGVTFPQHPQSPNGGQKKAIPGFAGGVINGKV